MSCGGDAVRVIGSVAIYDGCLVDRLEVGS
jgi:hypothetical protein